MVTLAEDKKRRIEELKKEKAARKEINRKERLEKIKKKQLAKLSAPIINKSKIYSQGNESQICGSQLPWHKSPSSLISLIVLMLAVFLLILYFLPTSCFKRKKQDEFEEENISHNRKISDNALNIKTKVSLSKLISSVLNVLKKKSIINDEVPTLINIESLQKDTNIDNFASPPQNDRIDSILTKIDLAEKITTKSNPDIQSKYFELKQINNQESVMKNKSQNAIPEFSNTLEKSKNKSIIKSLSKYRKYISKKLKATSSCTNQNFNNNVILPLESSDRFNSRSSSSSLDEDTKDLLDTYDKRLKTTFAAERLVLKKELTKKRVLVRPLLASNQSSDSSLDNY